MEEKNEQLAAQDQQSNSAPVVRSLANMEHVQEFSRELIRFVEQGDLTQKIQGKTYVLVDGWKFAGMAFGLYPEVAVPEQHENGDFYAVYERKTGRRGEYPSLITVTQDEEELERWKKDKRYWYSLKKKLYSYKCACTIRHMESNQTRGQGFALCTNMEQAKIGFDEFAVMSMVQTRAIGKAYRNLLGYVMKLAGFQDTPAEEMAEVQREAEMQKKQSDSHGVLPNWIVETITHYEDSDGLIEWAGSDDMAEYHSHPEFRKRVSAQQEKIKTGA